MIVSHKYKFIFIAIPKTATHAIRFALRPHLASNDWEQVELFHRSRAPIAGFENINHGHITAQVAKEALGKEIWDSYYKFAFVRNPFDRFISYSFFKNKNSEIFKKHALAKMKLAFQDPFVLNDLLFQPQIDFINDEEGGLMVDYVGRYEQLQKSFNAISKQTGIKSVELPLLNTTDHEKYHGYYDEELRGLVEIHYKKEIELFNYSF